MPTLPAGGQSGGSGTASLPLASVHLCDVRRLTLPFLRQRDRSLPFLLSAIGQLLLVIETARLKSSSSASAKAERCWDDINSDRNFLLVRHMTHLPWRVTPASARNRLILERDSNQPVLLPPKSLTPRHTFRGVTQSEQEGGAPFFDLPQPSSNSAY